jgi:hypothetical protein
VEVNQHDLANLVGGLMAVEQIAEAIKRSSNAMFTSTIQWEIDKH